MCFAHCASRARMCFLSQNNNIIISIIIIISQIRDVDAREPWLDLNLNMKQSINKFMASNDRGITASDFSLSIACNPVIFNGLVTVTTLHLAYLDRKETPAVVETSRRRLVSDDVLSFPRTVRVAGQAWREQATTERLSLTTGKGHQEQTKQSQNSIRKSHENRQFQSAKQTCKINNNNHVTGSNRR